jgi:hypothetical protein
MPRTGTELDREYHAADFHLRPRQTQDAYELVFGSGIPLIPLQARVFQAK